MLDSISTYEKYDKDEVSFDIERLPEQVHMAWGDTRNIVVSAGHKAANHIVIAGMGGSGLAGHLIQAGLADEMKTPLTIIHGYELPAFVTSKTLVVLTSFSGNTEEVLAMAADAKKKKAKIVVVTSGGQLLKLAKKNKWPVYQFDPSQLAREPRFGVGFMFAGTLGLLERAGFVKMSNARIARLIEAMADVIDSCTLHVPTEENPAKIVATELKGKSLLYVAAEHLFASAHVMSNQTNETSKLYARFQELPELNHHFLESLSRPVGFFAKFGVVMVRSSHYHKRNQARFDITAKMFEKVGGTVIDYETRGKTRLEEVAEMLQFGSFLSYYLGVQNKVDLASIPFVYYFKKQMAKRKS